MWSLEQLFPQQCHNEPNNFSQRSVIVKLRGIGAQLSVADAILFIFRPKIDGTSGDRSHVRFFIWPLSRPDYSGAPHIFFAVQHLQSLHY